MKILLIASYLPYPLYDGGRIRLYNLIKELSKKHKITLICERRSYQTDKDVAEVKKFCQNVFTIPHKKPWTLENILKTIFSRYPLLLIMHTFPEMKKKIVETLNMTSFDLIHVETFYVMQNLPKTYLPVILAEHNIEYKVYERYANNKPWYMRLPLYLDIWKIRYWEEYFWKRATSLVAVSEIEKRIMKRSDVVVVPNGVDLKNYTFRSPGKILKKKERRILFIGDFKWIQNQEATKWILTEIWPLLKSRIIDQELKIRLWIVGRSIPDNIKNLGDDTVLFDENAPDTKKIFQQSTVLLAPIKVGGGTSYKILEAMATGVPVATTPLGVAGFEVDRKKDVLVAETPEEFVSQLLDVLQSKERYVTIASNARKKIEEKYNWEIISRTLDNVYQRTIA